MNDDSNPYQAPGIDANVKSSNDIPESQDSLLPQRCFRLVLVFLAVPALTNYIAFDLTYVSAVEPIAFRWQCRLTNLVLFATGAAALWFFGWWGIAAALRMIKGSIWADDASAWHEQDKIRRLVPMLLVFGGVVASGYSLWVLIFYHKLFGF